MNPIKIVYNWIGPKGPIPNTETPNLLNLAGVMSDVQVRSTKFWADDIWHKIFIKDPEHFQLTPAFPINADDVFIYPMYVSWRIDFEKYFLKDNGILEFGHVPNHIIHHVRMNKGYFLIEMAAEAYVRWNHLNALHTYFIHNQIPLNKIIYLTGCMNPDDVYYNIAPLDAEKINLITFPVSQASLASHLTSVPPPEEPDYPVDFIPEKKFLMWNRRYRRHRYALALMMEQLGLTEKNYISMPLVSDENSEKFLDKIDFEFLRHIGIGADTVATFVAKLPLVLDGETDIQKMCSDFDNATRPFYQNSLVSIITETNFDDNELTLTEKSFKPMKEKHPFIIVGVPNALKSLKSLGYKTFSDFWSEDYDSIADHWDRAKEIMRVCNEIAQWDDNKIRDFRVKVKDILDYNYNNLKVDGAHFAYQEVLKIIRGNQ
jgi:hypothetical protein